MQKVAVVTDSSASIPEMLRAELDIRIVPFLIQHGEKTWRDLIDIHQEEFYRWLPTVDVLPTTAYPGPGNFFKVYEELAGEGFHDIVSIHITSRSSGTVQGATVAAGMAEERLEGVRVKVIDTLNVAMCQGWMAIEAARAARDGAEVNEIEELIQRMIPVTDMIQTADTLKYLHMGGRIGSAKHLLGKMLKIKPLIGMRDGIIVALGTERSRDKAYHTMAKMVEQAVGPEGKIKVAYVHVAAPEEVEKIRVLLEGRVTSVESVVAELAPSLGVHSGPGTAGICYFPAEALEK
ncbi:MAG TPA: DegV family protein [Firmicutes bacterium]|nr:DegV family protein [Bacillota bacterium]